MMRSVFESYFKTFPMKSHQCKATSEILFTSIEVSPSVFPSNICQLSTATPRCSKTGLFSLSSSADSAVLARKTQVNTALPMRNKLFRADEDTKLCYVAMY